MPRKICPLCKKAYIHFVREYKKFSHVVKRIYSCENCGIVTHDLKEDIWVKEVDKKAL